nr:hypothetical protein [Rhodothermus marinus]
MTRPATTPTTRRAFWLIVLFGLVSLLADLTYESARSLIGPYLAGWAPRPRRWAWWPVQVSWWATDCGLSAAI